MNLCGRVFRQRSNIARLESVFNTPVCFSSTIVVIIGYRHHRVTLRHAHIIHVLQPTPTVADDFSTGSCAVNGGCLAVIGSQSSLVTSVVPVLVDVHVWYSFSRRWIILPTRQPAAVASTVTTSLLRMSICRVHVAVFSQRRVISSPTNTHRSASVRVRCLWTAIQPRRPLTNSLAHTQWRTSFRLLRVWSSICTRRRAKPPHDSSYSDTSASASLTMSLAHARSRGVNPCREMRRGNVAGIPY